MTIYNTFPILFLSAVKDRTCQILKRNCREMYTYMKYCSVKEVNSIGIGNGVWLQTLVFAIATELMSDIVQKKNCKQPQELISAVCRCMDA